MHFPVHRDVQDNTSLLKNLRGHPFIRITKNLRGPRHRTPDLLNMSISCTPVCHYRDPKKMFVIAVRELRFYFKILLYLQNKEMHFNWRKILIWKRQSHKEEW